MFIFKRFFKFIGNLGDRVICIALALLLTQLPTYISQYQDTLSGARMEAERIFADLDALAAGYNLDVDEYLDTLASNTSRMVSENAQVQKTAIKRYRRYDAAYRALESSPIWARPFTLLRHFDRSVHASIDFEPNVPMTLEGGIYALIGLLIGMLIIGLFKGIYNWIARKFNPKRPVYDPYKYRRKPVDTTDSLP